MVFIVSPEGKHTEDVSSFSGIVSNNHVEYKRVVSHGIWDAKFSGDICLDFCQTYRQRNASIYPNSVISITHLTSNATGSKLCYNLLKKQIFITLLKRSTIGASVLPTFLI